MWLKTHKRTKEDVEAIRDCLRRAEACTYFSWPRGSRLFFWKFGNEWHADMRDGVSLWHIAKAPRGYPPNIPASSREAELLARRKVFALRFQGFIEQGQYVKLGTPRFLVDKLVEDGVVLDVRCVWDCKSSGLNATLWAPGFMLPTFRRAEDQVVKWLSTTVKDYLERGNPVEDYTQDTTCFIKSYQGDTY